MRRGARQLRLLLPPRQHVPAAVEDGIASSLEALGEEGQQRPRVEAQLLLHGRIDRLPLAEDRADDELTSLSNVAPTTTVAPGYDAATPDDEVIAVFFSLLYHILKTSFLLGVRNCRSA